jgi:hypothetical protein
MAFVHDLHFRYQLCHAVQRSRHGRAALEQTHRSDCPAVNQQYVTLIALLSIMAFRTFDADPLLLCTIPLSPPRLNALQ